MKRRTVLKTAALVVAGSAAWITGRASTQGNERAMSNEDFYDNGRFSEERAKDAVLRMCRTMGYPVFAGMRENLWVSDYGTGQFARLGLAAYIFANQYNERGSYMLLDIFLLPGQMLPEHWHLEGDHGITKNEGWLVRWGKSYIVGIGEDNLASYPDIRIPQCHLGGRATARHVVEATAGTFVPLAKLESPHWQYGGAEGAIVTEVANYHTTSAVRHSDPELNRFFLQ